MYKIQVARIKLSNLISKSKFINTNQMSLHLFPVMHLYALQCNNYNYLFRPKTAYQWILYGVNRFQSTLSQWFYQICFNIILLPIFLLTSHLFQNALTLEVLRTRIFFINAALHSQNMMFNNVILTHFFFCLLPCMYVCVWGGE